MGSFSGSTFVLPKGAWGSQTVHASTIAAAEVATEESVKRLGGTLGWGAAGGLILGPVGLLAGLLLGGRKTEVTFIVTFTDHRALIATADLKTWTAIKGAALRFSAENARMAAMTPPAPAAPTRTLPPRPAASASASELLEWAFSVCDWDFVCLPRRQFQRYDVYDAKKGMRSAHIVVSPDPLTDYYVYEYYERFQELGSRDERMILAPIVRPSALRDAKEWRIKVITPTELPDAIEQR
jgi:hypothetical protein